MDYNKLNKKRIYHIKKKIIKTFPKSFKNIRQRVKNERDIKKRSIKEDYDEKCRESIERSKEIMEFARSTLKKFKDLYGNNMQ